MENQLKSFLLNSNKKNNKKRIKVGKRFCQTKKGKEKLKALVNIVLKG